MIILRLPAHLAHLFKPFDWSVLRPVKLCWQQLLRAFARTPVSKKSFPGPLKNLFERSFTAESRSFELVGSSPSTRMLCQGRNWNQLFHSSTSSTSSGSTSTSCLTCCTRCNIANSNLTRHNTDRSDTNSFVDKERQQVAQLHQLCCDERDRTNRMLKEKLRDKKDVERYLVLTS